MQRLQEVAPRTRAASAASRLQEGVEAVRRGSQPRRQERSQLRICGLMKPVGFEPTTSWPGRSTMLSYGLYRRCPDRVGILTMVIYQRYSLHLMNFIFTR